LQQYYSESGLSYHSTQALLFYCWLHLLLTDSDLPLYDAAKRLLFMLFINLMGGGLTGAGNRATINKC
jgi:hypothetical protein